MTSRPPHPPAANGRLVDLWRRGRLTLKYHGTREVALRLVTFPLRATPLGPRLGYGRRFGAEEARARRWYRKHWRPVTVVIPTYGDPRLVEAAVASVRKTTERKRVSVVVVDDCSPDRSHRERVQRLRGARIELLEPNGGFAKAVNRGI